MLHVAYLGMLVASTTQVPTEASSTIDPVAFLVGEWEIVDESGKTLQECSKAQTFKATPDGLHIDLTERGVADWSAHYLIIHRDKNRVLMFIEKEDRTTEQGDPVLWWAYFDGPDKFRWRRYDWDATAATATEWRRCRT